MAYKDQCPKCGEMYDLHKGHICRDDSDLLDDVAGDTANVSVPEATLEELIEKASIPDLSALYRKGRETGLIKPGKEYGGSSN